MAFSDSAREAMPWRKERAWAWLSALVPKDFGGWSGHTATSLDLFYRVMYEASIDGSGSSVKELHSLRIRLMWLSKNNEARASGQMSPVAYELAGVL